MKHADIAFDTDLSFGSIEDNSSFETFELEDNAESRRYTATFGEGFESYIVYMPYYTAHIFSSENILVNFFKDRFLSQRLRNFSIFQL